MMQPGQPLRIPAIVWILGAAFLAVVPMLILGNAWGYDFDFHTAMWLDAADQFRQGNLLPRWAAGANAGFGEPSMIFYPPLSWMAGGVLGLMLPWKIVASAYVFLTLALAGGAMWRLAGEWLPPRDAVFAGMLYTLNPYTLVNVYKRCAYGELLAGALFPLLVWAAIRLARDGQRRVPALTLIFAAIWLADLPAGLIASYSLALLLALSSLLNRSFRPALLGSLAIVAAFLSLAFFLFPAEWERQWVEISLVFRPDWVPENNFVFTPNIDPIMALFSRGISYISVLLVLSTAVATALTGRLRRQVPTAWLMVVILAAASAFLVFRSSSMIWNVMPALRYVEYPWRWLTPLSLANALLIAAAIAEHGAKRLLHTGVLGCFVVLGAAMLISVRWDSHQRHIQEVAAKARSGAGFRFNEGKDWRLPLNSHPSRLPDFAPLVETAGGTQNVRIRVSQWTAERKSILVDAVSAAELKIKLLNYPAWAAKINGQPVALQTDPSTGQMLLPVRAGTSKAEIIFTRTWDRTAGMVVSLILILALVLFSLLRWVRTRAGNPA